MIYLIGSDSFVIQDFLSKNAESIIKISRRKGVEDTIFWDLSDPKVPDELKKLISADKSISIIYAAAFKSQNLFLSETEENIAQSININFLSFLALAKFSLKYMMAYKTGNIVYLGSSQAEKDGVGASLYSSTKQAAIKLTQDIGKEYGRFGLNSNVVMLGYFDGPLWTSIPEAKRSEMLKALPSKRLGGKDELTEVINLVLKNKYINAQKIYLDGGL
jgi:NAD(P)-dependent dehydrogenase (short-subunit alcohol dehydrogenase family)